MPGRGYNPGSYRYGYNKGSEKEKEINENVYSTFFRELDTRIGRWWGIDPVPNVNITPYASMDNNPIKLFDPLGSSTHTDKDGKVVAVYNDHNYGVFRHRILPKTFAATDRNIDKKTPKLTGGKKMGETMMWNSFANFDHDNSPKGTIHFKSFEAKNWIDKFIKEFEGYSSNNKGDYARLFYAKNAGGFDTYDFKTNGIIEGQLGTEALLEYVYRGSQLVKGVYVSARDIGNFAAGSIARITGQSKLDFMLIAGAFNMCQNKKVDLLLNLNRYKKAAYDAGFPAFGESPFSNFFQRAGYENIRSLKEYEKGYFKFWHN